MGRPLPKYFFTSDDKIPVLANLGNGNVDAWLIEQRTSTSYIATDGVATALVQLQKDEPTKPGQAYCVIETNDGDRVVRQINRNHAKTFNGPTYKWIHEDTPQDGQGVFKMQNDFVKDPDIPVIEMWMASSSEHWYPNTTNTLTPDFVIATEDDLTDMVVHYYANNQHVGTYVITGDDFDNDENWYAPLTFTNWGSFELRAELRATTNPSSELYYYLDGVDELIVRLVQPTLASFTVSLREPAGEPDETIFQPEFLLNIPYGQVGDNYKCIVEFDGNSVQSIDEDSTLSALRISPTNNLNLGTYTAYFVLIRNDNGEPAFSTTVGFTFTIIPE